jgi:hypothetical protein
VRTASTTLPVPASPFERIIAAPSEMRRSASPRLVAPHTNGTSKANLSMWWRLVGRGEHLGLVDEVDTERLQDLASTKWPMRALAITGIDTRPGSLDHLGVAHPGHAAVATDVGRHPLERHHGHGAGVLGDLGLLGGDDVHDDAALHHLGESPLDGEGSGASMSASSIHVLPGVELDRLAVGVEYSIGKMALALPRALAY